MRIVVIGVGQSMRGDDAAGLEAVRRWRESHPDVASRGDVQVVLTEQPGLGMLELLEGMDGAVLVDAVASKDGAGSVQRIRPQDLDAFNGGTRSAHGWGVAETLLLGQAVDAIPADFRVRLIGIGAGQFQEGSGLSPAVTDALPAACKAIQEEVETFLGT